MVIVHLIILFSAHKDIDLELLVAHKEIELARLGDQVAILERALEQVHCIHFLPLITYKVIRNDRRTMWLWKG